MLFDSTNGFRKGDIDFYLQKIGKEFRKLNGNKMPAEIILIGGASILVNYGFRDNTYDFDAIIKASSVMKEAINHVGDELGLPNGWFNSDFTRTKSYSPKLSQYSDYYKTFSNILSVRTISREYLVAMKLMSFRQYKNDLSDIIGILWEQQNNGKPITFGDIDRAVYNLYGGWESLPRDAMPQIEEILNNDDLENLYHVYRDNEIKTKQALIDFETEYHGVLTEENIGDIIKELENKINDTQEQYDYNDEIKL
ncbi:MAG: DUF6036 family nucleotidyltransferase [Clostridium sp.]|nr:DUF6036 family nucleotidyltransferase [Clostridium sp.]